ncbi:unnamed protein product, partial [Ectocarpus sp. 13 AM-2016]
DCAACSSLSNAQVEALASYDNGGKRVVCDVDCLSSSPYDVSSCNYFDIAQICRGCGDCTNCTPCPGPAPSPAPIASTAETPAPVAGLTPFVTRATVSPTATETVAVEEDVTYAPAPHASAAYGTGTPAETDFADLSTPAPVDPVAPTADAGVDVEIDVDTDADGDGDDADTTSDCAACSNLSEVQMLALAAYPGGAKRVVCDPDCLEGVDVLDCDYFGLGQICRGCGVCDGCEACP